MMECFSTMVFMEHYKVKQVFINRGWDGKRRELVYEKVFGQVNMVVKIVLFFEILTCFVLLFWWIRQESIIHNLMYRAYENLEQAAKKKSLPPKELEKFVDKTNRRRAEYTEFYTGEKWIDAHNYDLCLDSSKLGFEKCVQIIKGYMKVRFDGLTF